MLLIEPVDPWEESRNRLNAQHELVRELGKKRLLWNILIGAVPIGLWLTGMLVRSGMEQGSSLSSTVSMGTVILQFTALGVTLLIHQRYAKKLEQARMELQEMNLKHSRIPLEESREDDAA